MWSSWDKNEHLQLTPSRPEKGGLPSPGWWRSSASDGGVQVSQGLIDKWGKNGAWVWQVDPSRFCSYAVSVPDHHGEESLATRQSSYSPTLINCQDLWLMTKRTRSPAIPADASAPVTWFRIKWENTRWDETLLALLPIELCHFYLLPHFVASLLFMRQVHLSVSQVSVSLSVDCQHVSERSARPLGNLPTDGFEMLGKFVNARGPASGSAPVISLFLSAHRKFILAH